MPPVPRMPVDSTLLTALAAGALFLGPVAQAIAEELPAFAVAARGGRIVPERLEVPAGTRVKLTLRNEDSRPMEFENETMHVEKVLAPGASSFVVLPKLKPGQYVFVDEFNAGRGTVTVIAR